MNSAQTFGATTLTEGSPYTYSTQIRNTGGQSWSGSIYLRVNGRDIGNQSIVIPAGSTQIINFNYTPTSADVGTGRSVQIYYQTGGSSVGIPVPQGSYANPTTVNINALPTPTITINSPSSSSSFVLGSPINVSWTSSNLNGNVSLELYTCTGVYQNQYIDNLPANGSYSFSQTSGLVAGQQYKIKAYRTGTTTAQGLTWSSCFTIGSPTVSVSPANISFAASGGTATFTITSNTSWVINRIPTLSTWASTNTGSGIGNGTITVTCQANTTPDSRTVTFRVSLGNGITKDVVVTQSGSCGDPNPTATNITNNSALITWNSIAGATSYKVAVTGTGISLVIPNYQGVSYPLTGLTANTTYAYTVQAICGSTNGTYTAKTFTTSAPQPARLEIVQAINMGGSPLYVGTTYTLRTKIKNTGGTKYVGKLAIVVKINTAYYTLNETTWNIDPGVTLDLVMNYTPTVGTIGSALKAGIFYLNDAGIWDYVPQGSYLNPIDGVSIQQRVDVIPQFAIQSNTLSLPTPWQQRDVVNIQYVLRNSNTNPWTGCLSFYAINNATSQRYLIAEANTNGITSGQTATLSNSQFNVSNLPVGTYYFFIIGKSSCLGTEYELVRGGLFNVSTTNGRYTLNARSCTNSNFDAPATDCNTTNQLGTARYIHLQVSNTYDRCRLKVEWYDANNLLQQMNETDWVAANGAGSLFRQTFSRNLNITGSWKIRVFVSNDFMGYREWDNFSIFVPTSVAQDNGSDTEIFKGRDFFNKIIYKNSSISLYPNPVTNELNIEMSSVEESNIQLSVTDILGKEVTHLNKAAIKGLNQYQINTTNLNNGLYLLHIKSKEGLISRKFTIQH